MDWIVSKNSKKTYFTKNLLYKIGYFSELFKEPLYFAFGLCLWLTYFTLGTLGIIQGGYTYLEKLMLITNVNERYNAMFVYCWSGNVANMKLHWHKVSTKIQRPTYPRMKILPSLIIYDWPLKALPLFKKMLS